MMKIFKFGTDEQQLEIKNFFLNFLSRATYKQQLEVTKEFRELLLKSMQSIDKVIDTGIIPKLVEFLQIGDYDLQSEAAWGLSIITAGNSLQISCVVDAGALQALVDLLTSPCENVQDHAVSCLGNIVDDGPVCRDLALDHGILTPLLQ